MLKTPAVGAGGLEGSPVCVRACGHKSACVNVCVSVWGVHSTAARGRMCVEGMGWGVVCFSSLCLAEPFLTALDAFGLLNNLVGILLALGMIRFRMFYLKENVYINLRTQKPIFNNRGFDLCSAFPDVA